MIEYFCWCCEYNNTSGEGLLGKKFINKYFKNKKIKILLPKKKIFFKDYIYPYMGIIILWFYYFKGKKIIYLNYLPLWNFLLFILCPPKTIFGPITGSIQINKINSLKSIIRYFLFPYFYKLSLIFLNIRCNKIIFATNILKKYLNKKILKKSLLNFVLSDFKTNKSKIKKKYDLIIYFRRHENKFFEHHFKFIKNFITKNKKVIVVGDKLNIKGINHFGRVNKIYLNKLIQKSKYSLSGDDNLLSIFNIDCLKFNVKIIYNNKLNFQIPYYLKKNFISHNYKNRIY